MFLSLPSDVVVYLVDWVPCANELAQTCRLLRKVLFCHRSITARVNPNRIEAGMLLWMREAYDRLVHLRVYYLPTTDPGPADSVCVSQALAAAAHLVASPRLRSVELILQEFSVDLEEVTGVFTARVPETVSVDLSFHSGITAETLRPLWNILGRSSSLTLRLSNVDLGDATLRGLLRPTGAAAPRWRRLHLDLAHNLITDAGCAVLLPVLANCPDLQDVKLDMSYNNLQAARKVQRIRSALPDQIRRFRVRVDTDRWDPEVLDLSPAAAGVADFTLRAAYHLVVPSDFRVGSVLTRAHLDLQGGRILNQGLVQIGLALVSAQNTLRNLRLDLSHTGTQDPEFLQFCDQGLRQLHALEVLSVNLSRNELTTLEGLVQGMPPRVSELRVVVSEIHTLRLLPLVRLPHVLRCLYLEAQQLCLEELSLPGSVQQLVLDVRNTTIESCCLAPAILCEVGLLTTRVDDLFGPRGWCASQLLRVCRLDLCVTGGPEEMTLAVQSFRMCVMRGALHTARIVLENQQAAPCLPNSVWTSLRTAVQSNRTRWREFTLQVTGFSGRNQGSPPNLAEGTAPRCTRRRPGAVPVRFTGHRAL